jgi:hypothetical protein
VQDDLGVPDESLALEGLCRSAEDASFILAVMPAAAMWLSLAAA